MFSPEELGAYKVARKAHMEIQKLKINKKWSKQIDFQSLIVRTKSHTDNDELIHRCYRCTHINPILSDKVNLCICSLQNFRQILNIHKIAKISVLIGPGKVNVHINIHSDY